MTVSEALRGVTRLFLDTAPVIYFVENNPLYRSRVDEIFDMIDLGSPPAVTSSVTLAEAMIHPIRRRLVPLQQMFADLIVHGKNTMFVTLGEKEATKAAELRARHDLSLTDAFQVARALEAGCDALLTNDSGLGRVTEIRIIVIDALEP